MQIHGFNKTTLLDYPEHIAATVLQGLQFSLSVLSQRGTGAGSRLPAAHSGGRSTLLPEKGRGFSRGLRHRRRADSAKGSEGFLRKIKELGYPIELDTNGYMPGVLWDLMQEHLIDYVAMDIKASRDNYARAAGLPHMDISRIEESIGILKSSGIPYEFRTTVVKGIHTVVEFEKIGKWIAGCPAYYLQNYEENENCLYRMIQTAECDDVKPGGVDPFGAFSREELEQMEELARKYVGKVILRGVE